MVTQQVRRLGLLLGDQLSFDLSLFDALEPALDAILMAEVNEEARYVPHHPQKIVLIFSAMRHFAQELRERGWRVIYTTLDDADNSGSIVGELRRWHAAIAARPATGRAYALTTQVNPDAGKPLTDEERRQLFGR